MEAPLVVAAPPWGAYVHVPWCHRRCPYCDFYFEVGAAHAGFPDAISAEVRARRHEAPPTAAQSLYLGGGTPSLLSDDALAALIEVLRGLPLTDDAEITLEANPEDLEPGRLARLARAGINRLSLGVQSFDDDVLMWLGRAHRGADARRVVEEALGAGIPRVSIDLICGVPDERAERLDADVDCATQLGVGHVSAYLLTVEPNTPLVQLIRTGKRAAVDDDQQADAYERLQQALPARGLAQYEISSFAMPGHESRHNRLYWAKGSYLGLGPSAHSMRLLPAGGVARRHTTASAERWLLDPAAAPFEEEHLSREEAFAEAVAFGLRDMLSGVDVHQLALRHGVAVPSALVDVLTAAEKAGRVRHDTGRVRLTPTGARFGDAVAADVLYAATQRE